jgi:sialidase-1
MRVTRGDWIFGVILSSLACGCGGGGDAPDAGPPLDAARADAGPGTLEAQVLFEKNADGYAVVRIPALVTTASGALLAFAEGRQSIEDDGDIDLVLRRSDDLGATWSDLQVVVDVGADTAGNPTPIATSAGRVWLPYCTNPGADMMARSVWLTWSDDDGLTWATPRELTADVKPAGWTWYATGPGRGIELSTGRLLVPCDHTDELGVTRSHVIYSDDQGETWQLGGSAGPDTDEATVAELADGRVVLNMRYEGAVRARALATSDDGGLTWSETTLDERLPDPACEGSLLVAPEGMLFANPATTIAFPRDHVTVRLSPDEGATWPYARVLDEGPSAYSSLTRLSDGRFGVLWESGRTLPYDRIRFARFDLAWVSVPAP